MPAIYIAHSTGYVDDPDSHTAETDRYRLDEYGDPYTVVDVISTLVERHMNTARGDLTPMEFALSRAETLTAALRAYSLRALGLIEGCWRDSITDDYALRSEIAVWSEPTLEELSS